MSPTPETAATAPPAMALVVNTRSRRGRRGFAAARDRLASHGLRPEDAHAVRGSKALVTRVGALVEAGVPMVVVGGGDGTASAVVDVFAEKPSILGLLPLGTANSFARGLGLPLDLDAALDVVVAGRVGAVDLARMDGDWFANAATVGLAAAVARARMHGLKAVFGRAAYALVGAGLLARHRPFRARITRADGTVASFDAVLEIRIANGPFKGGIRVEDRADLTSGELVVNVLKGSSRRALMAAWAALALGRRPNPAAYETLVSPSFTVETDPPENSVIDGEPGPRTPFRVEAVPGALRVMMPAGDRRS